MERTKARGFSLIELLIVIAVLSVIAAIAIILLSVLPKRSANEASAIASVRTLMSAESVYALTIGNGQFATFEELAANKVIDELLASGTKEGYDFTLTVGGNGTFTVTAEPISEDTGRRSFYGDESGVIRWRLGPGAGPGDPSLGRQ